ncbi:hypothetical protein OCQ_04280 [Mycobacterium paraintracellulare]|nr:hypothetical protein OCQ_04280 [Mycobacterium paraintracellulare]
MGQVAGEAFCLAALKGLDTLSELVALGLGGAKLHTVPLLSGHLAIC